MAFLIASQSLSGSLAAVGGTDHSSCNGLFLIVGVSGAIVVKAKTTI